MVNGKLKGGKPPVITESTTSTTEPTSIDNTFANWSGWNKTSLSLLPTSMTPPPHAAVYKSLTFSPFNPPPPSLRQRGHLCYATLVTLENESLMLVCTTRGWYVARSTAPSTSFDPTPRTVPKETASHSLMDLLHGVSPLFTSSLRSLQNPLSPEKGGPTQLEPISTIPIPQHPPSYPWLASPPSLRSHTPDLIRTQLAYAYTGATRRSEGLE